MGEEVRKFGIFVMLWWVELNYTTNGRRLVSVCLYWMHALVTFHEGGDSDGTHDYRYNDCSSSQAVWYQVVLSETQSYLSKMNCLGPCLVVDQGLLQH